VANAAGSSYVFCYDSGEPIFYCTPKTSSSGCVTLASTSGAAPPISGASDSPTSCGGSSLLALNDGNVIPFGLDAGAGNTGWYPWWHRDPQSGAGNLGAALSNGVEPSFQ